MKSVELFVALGLATTVGLSSNAIVNAGETELASSETNQENLYLIAGSDEGGEGAEGGEGGEGTTGTEASESLGEESTEEEESTEGGEDGEGGEGGEG